MLKHFVSLFTFAAVFLSFAVEPLDWSKSVEVQKGISHLKIERTEPRLMKINILRIDLKTPGLDFTATDRDKDWGKEMPEPKCEKYTIRTKRQRTREFMKETREKGLNVVVAVNAAPWGPWQRPFNHKYADVSGVNILNGRIISDRKNGAGPVFVIWKNGTPEILSRLNLEDYGSIKIALSGFSIIARNGKSTYRDKSLAPRTAYGISADKRYLYLLVVDGRQKDWSMGMSCQEAGLWLLAAGASDAINMDGGGSTTLIYWDEKAKKMVPLSRHSRSGYERTVANSMGIILPPSEK